MIQVDANDSLSSAIEERPCEVPWLPGEREHSAVMIFVAVAVQQPRIAHKGRPDRVQRDGVPAFGDVGHRDKRQRSHDRTDDTGAGGSL